MSHEARLWRCAGCGHAFWSHFRPSHRKPCVRCKQRQGFNELLTLYKLLETNQPAVVQEKRVPGLTVLDDLERN